MPSIARTEWWLMECSFPDLNWARLRVFEDGDADVFDGDGHLEYFGSEEQARLWLLEDEYLCLARIDLEDIEPHGLALADLIPPVGGTEAELLPQMMQHCRRAYDGQ